MSRLSQFKRACERFPRLAPSRPTISRIYACQLSKGSEVWVYTCIQDTMGRAPSKLRMAAVGCYQDEIAVPSAAFSAYIEASLMVRVAVLYPTRGLGDGVEVCRKFK